MENLIAVCNRMTAMADDYNNRIREAEERILSLGKELQEEKTAMNAAAAADDMDAYREHEARVRFLTARMEASKSVQTSPLFSSPDEAENINREYRAAVNAAIRPVYARLKETMDEQTALLQELRRISDIASPGASRLSRHALQFGRTISPWTVSHDVSKYIEDGRYHAEQSINYVLNK